MRHARKINHLGRTNTHRKAMMANMASSLIMHKRITTTTAKAKALRVYVEPLITYSKEDTTHSRRMVFNYLQDKSAVSELFREISPKIINRPGGYTRILKLGLRKGDAAEMCMIELVDYNENMLAAKDTKAKATTRRSRRSTGGKKAEVTAASTAVEAEATPAAPKAKGKAAAKKVEAVKTKEVEEEVKDEAIIDEVKPEEVAETDTATEESQDSEVKKEE